MPAINAHGEFTPTPENHMTPRPPPRNHPRPAFGNTRSAMTSPTGRRATACRAVAGLAGAKKTMSLCQEHA